MNKRQTTLGIYSVEFYVCKYQYVYLSIPSMILNIIVRVRSLLGVFLHNSHSCTIYD